MRNQNFGIEIEMTGLTRSAAARIIAGHFETTATHVGDGYDTYTVRDHQNRQWKIVSDASIHCRSGQSIRPAGREYSVEFVSPICRYEDIETVQALVRKLRAGGALVNSSCGIHVHVDASAHTPQTLRNIVNIMASKEDLLYKTLQVRVSRENYCKKADTRFLDDLNHRRPKTMDEVERLWYNGKGDLVVASCAFSGSPCGRTRVRFAAPPLRVRPALLGSGARAAVAGRGTAKRRRFCTAPGVRRSDFREFASRKSIRSEGPPQNRGFCGEATSPGGTRLRLRRKRRGSRPSGWPNKKLRNNSKRPNRKYKHRMSRSKPLLLFPCRCERRTR